jgi:hypothetical protein
VTTLGPPGRLYGGALAVGNAVLGPNRTLYIAAWSIVRIGGACYRYDHRDMFTIPGSSAIAGLAVVSNGTIYLSDSGNSVIRKITPAGVVTTVAERGAEVDLA